MILSALIRKRATGNLATAIPATPATQHREAPGTVATIATVATVAVASLPSPESFDREIFEERAAIIEFDGGVARAEAELLAWEQVQASLQRLSPLEWLARYSPERLSQRYAPEHFPVAKLEPGPQFWEERERRGRAPSTGTG